MEISREGIQENGNGSIVMRPREYLTGSHYCSLKQEAGNGGRWFRFAMVLVQF